jgi:proline dehydrogenase
MITSRINLDNTEKAFAYKSDCALKKARFLFTFMKSAILVKIATKITPWLINVGFPIKTLIKRTLFDQFVGGLTLEDTGLVAKTLSQFNVQVILDFGIEGGEKNDQQYDAITKQFRDVITFASTQQNIPFISIKITGLTSITLLEKLNSPTKIANTTNQLAFDKRIIDLTTSEANQWNNLLARIESISQLAAEKNIGLMIDAEESWIQEPIDYIAESLMKKYNKEKVIVYNTIQLYRQDRLVFLKNSFNLARENNYILGMKLVRGAYMEKENKRADKLSYTTPIHLSKEATDHDFNEAVAFCLTNNKFISTIIASHNESSNLLATTKLIDLSIPPNHPHVHFSQLYGMSDNLTFNLSDAGFNVSKYLPFGPIEEVIPYLMRRAEENSSISGQTTRELNLITKECLRRSL